MTLIFFSRTVIAAGALIGAVTCAYAQTLFPTKPVRILATEAGGSSDLYSRIIAQGLTQRWGKPVIVENRASIVAIEALIRAQPDGYSLLSYASSFWLGPLMQRGTYDPLKDVTPITIALRAPNVLVVHPSMPVKSVKELIALVKARPGSFNYASGGAGSGGHLAGELFKSMAGVSIQRVPYKGIGLAINDLISGRVQLAFPGAGGVAPHIKSGKLRALAVTGSKPSELLPGLPTIAESGVPGYESVVVNAIFAPARTPAVIINRLNLEIVRYIKTAEAKEKFLNVGSEPVGSTVEELATTRKFELARMSVVIKGAGIRAD